MNRVMTNMVRDSRLMWALGNYSRFVRPNAVRLDVEGTQNTDGVMVSAYKNVDGSTVIVAINYSKQEHSINFVFNAKKATAYRTSDTDGETLKNIGEVNLRKAALMPRSITTFICK